MDPKEFIHEVANPEEDNWVAFPMKSVIQLTSDNSELFSLQTSEKSTHLLWLHGADFYFSLWDLDQWLREQVKYGEITDSEEEVFEIVRDKIREIMESHGVNLEMVA